MLEVAAVAVRVILRIKVFADNPACEKLLFISVELSEVLHYVHLVALSTFFERII